MENILSFWVKTNLKIRPICFKKDVTMDERKAVIDGLKSNLERLNKHMETRKFFAGDYVTISDIHFFETWTVMVLIHEEACKEYPNLMKLYENVKGEEWYKTYTASDRYIEKPLMAP